MEKEENDDLNDSEHPLVPGHNPPPKPPSQQPPTSPSSRRRLVKNRRGSRRSCASMDLDAAMDEMLDLDTACEQNELKEYVSMNTLDLDKLYKEGPKTKIHRMLSKKISKQLSVDAQKIAKATTTSTEETKPRAGSSSHRDSDPVPMTGLSQEEEKLRPRISSVQTGDLNILELSGAFELPPSWKDANTMVEELKAKYVYLQLVFFLFYNNNTVLFRYKAAKHAYYKDKTNETLKKDAVKLKAQLRAAEKHLST